MDASPGVANPPAPRMDFKSDPANNSSPPPPSQDAGNEIEPAASHDTGNIIAPDMAAEDIDMVSQAAKDTSRPRWEQHCCDP